MRYLSLLALVLPAVASAAPTLDVSGDCPGPIVVEVSGLAPGADMTLLFSEGMGSAAIPAGVCAGTVTGLDPVRRGLRAADLDGDGTIVFTPDVPEGACGKHVQALDNSDCSLSTVETVGAGGGPIGPSCREVAGITWCFHPSECGRACADTCAANGLSPMADRVAWFEAQNTAEECQPIADAFGAFEPVDLNSWSFGCMNDGHGSDHTGLDDTVNTAVPWLCSTAPSCTESIIDNMDQLGVPCGAGSRKTVCACE